MGRDEKILSITKKKKKVPASKWLLQQSPS